MEAGGSFKTSHLGTLCLKVAEPALRRVKRCGGVTGQEYNVGWYRVNNAPAGMIRQGFLILISKEEWRKNYEICEMV